MPNKKKITAVSMHMVNTVPALNTSTGNITAIHKKIIPINNTVTHTVNNTH